MALAVSASSHRLLALEARVANVRAVAATVRAGVDIKDGFPDHFKKLLDDGETLHVRIEAELWEDRPAWDRLVGPSVVTAFRLVRDRATQLVAVVDPQGSETTYTGFPNPFTVQIDLSQVSRIDDPGRYYVHAIATIGTLAQQDIDGVGEAVFGRDDEAGGLRTVGKFFLRKVLQINDYLQSISAETTSRKLTGKQIKTGGG